MGSLSRLVLALAAAGMFLTGPSAPARASIEGCDCDLDATGAPTGTVGCWGKCWVTPEGAVIDLQFANKPADTECIWADTVADIAPDPVCGPDGSSPRQWEIRGLTIPSGATHLKSMPIGAITCWDLGKVKEECKAPPFGLGPAAGIACPPATLADYRCSDAIMKAFSSLTSAVLACRRKQADEGFTDQQFDQKKCEAPVNAAFEKRLAYATTCSTDVLTRARTVRDELLGTGPRSLQTFSRRLYCDPGSGRPLDAAGPEAGWVPATTAIRSCANRTLETVTRGIKDVLRCRTLSSKAALDDHAFYSDCGQGRFTRNVVSATASGTCPSCLDVPSQDALQGLVSDIVKGIAAATAGACKASSVTCPRQNVKAIGALCAAAYGGAMELTYEGATDWFFKESVTDVADATKCSTYGGPITQTSAPFQWATGVLSDRIVNHNGPPGNVAPCTDTTSQVIFAGPTEAAVESCRFPNTQVIRVTKSPNTVQTSQAGAVASCAY